MSARICYQGAIPSIRPAARWFAVAQHRRVECRARECYRQSGDRNMVGGTLKALVARQQRRPAQRAGRWYARYAVAVTACLPAVHGYIWRRYTIHASVFLPCSVPAWSFPSIIEGRKGQPSGRPRSSGAGVAMEKARSLRVPGNVRWKREFCVTRHTIAGWQRHSQRHLLFAGVAWTDTTQLNEQLHYRLHFHAFAAS